MPTKERVIAAIRRGADPALAIAVWAIMLLLCVLSSNSLKSFVESVGDLGPVIVAWLVYQLGREQHRANKLNAEREHRRQLFDRRRDIYDRYTAVLNTIMRTGEATYENVFAAKSVIHDASLVFEPEAIAPIEVLRDQALRMAGAGSRLKAPKNEETRLKMIDIQDDALGKIIELFKAGEESLLKAIRLTI